MKYRPYGRTGVDISEISFGAWAIGGTWGEVNDDDSMAALHAALDSGVNFIDTADVYGDGRSERLIARLRKERPSDTFFVATKAGRRLDPHTAEGYNPANLEPFLDRSRANLEVETLDLVQLHCPPTDVYYDPSVFEFLEEMVKVGKIKHWGVSVARVEEGLKAIEYPGCQSVQIIFNVFRQRPADLFLARCLEKSVGVLARLPLSSGMLTGKMSRSSTFEAGDHRAGNRDGEWFDKGETFSGLPYEVGLDAVDEIKSLLPNELSMTEFALRWILQFRGVTAAIPGGKKPEQVVANCAASGKPSLDDEVMRTVEKIYASRVKGYVHDRW